MVEPLGGPRPDSASQNRKVLRVVARAGPSTHGPVAKPCTCGHGKAAHEHYRAGSDCALCTCPRYRGPLLAKLRLRRR